MNSWESILGNVQDNIEKYGQEHYKEAYRLEEIYYWYHIPRWMYEDSLVNKDIKTVLDVGCGHGALSCFAKEIYKDADIYSVDVVRYLAEEIEAEYNLKYYLLDIETEIEKIYNKGFFDRIICTEVVEHLFYNPAPTLYNLMTMLKENGLLFLSTPDAVEWGRLTTIYKHIGEMPRIGKVEKPDFNTIDYHIYQYGEGELLRIFDESGLEVEKFDFSKPGHRARHFNYQLKKR
jgi:2-polyprenyl-3-methyl-5-hydroxy-6-metoxy-1,4-benzoquinol methylase